MTNEYNPAAIEQTTQARWEKAGTYKASEDLNNGSGNAFYCLEMLPYPSGELHMGHVRNYTLGDVVARFHAQQGKNVLHPMGWDAFGLPAENAAIKHKLPPHEWTQSNIAKMREQLKQLGFSFDWSREIATCDPEYYRWEQWLFTKLFERGLAYKKESLVNWDPVDQTVLANEQVVDGCGWRSGAPVEKKTISQWFLKITDYADELLDGLDDLTGWPDDVRLMQRNWIGRSHGSNVTFPLQTGDESITVYTTRADTLFGVTYLAIAADHPLAKQAAEGSAEIAAFLDECKQTSVAEADLAKQDKKGIDTDITVINPVNGAVIPLWVANYVISGTGTGAVMAVPAHDQRDFEFSRQYGLPIQPVIATDDWDYTHAAYTDYGHLINSDAFDGLDSETAKTQITASLKERKLGEPTTNYRLRDWGISRQRYWGTPIPIIYCDDCGAVPVPEKDLPVVLPTDIIPTGSGSPLASDETFCQTTCPTCGKAARRETDTMDTFVESSWYYTRYCCPDQHEAMLDDRAKYWTPVDQYIGGVEHAVMHLLYARFFHKVLRDMGLLNSNEPFTNLLTQGMVLKDGHKMSKSKGNTVAPQPLIERYGADTVRLFMMFAAPPVHDLEWMDSGVEGSYRFLRRVWQITHNIIQRVDGQTDISLPSELSKTGKNLRRETHQLLKQAHFDMTRMQFNTVASACMKLNNHLSKALESVDTEAAVLLESLRILLLALTPIAPHITEALWKELGETTCIHKTSWPEPDHQALVEDSIEYVVQVNGKLRARLEFDTSVDEEAIKEAVLEFRDLQPFLADKTVKRIIVVPKKLINIVVV
jgi:leucyl-tRNA synthetase